MTPLQGVGRERLHGAWFDRTQLQQAHSINLFMEGGESSLEEMIQSVRRGIYVTRFHYTNVVEPMKAVITGMTRDGTF